MNSYKAYIFNETGINKFDSESLKRIEFPFHLVYRELSGVEQLNNLNFGDIVIIQANTLEYLYRVVNNLNQFDEFYVVPNLLIVQPDIDFSIKVVYESGISKILFLPLDFDEYQNTILNFTERISCVNRVMEQVLSSKLARKVIDSEENIRKFLAMELHDGLGPILSSALMHIEGINSSEVERDSKLKFFYKNLRELIKEGIDETRSLINQLSPKELSEKGLCFVLEHKIDSLNQLGITEFKFIQNIEQKRFPELVEVTIYRIVLELLTNILKYAKADIASLEISYHSDEICVRVKDDGIGFEEDKILIDNSKGRGLENMRERLKQINGYVELTKPKDHGSIFNIHIPLINGDI